MAWVGIQCKSGGHFKEDAFKFRVGAPRCGVRSATRFAGCADPAHSFSGMDVSLL